MNIKDDEFGIIVHISNDAWFGNSGAPFQHLQIAQSRALESSKYLIRAANTGISAVINPQGVVLQKLHLNSEGVINGKLYASKGQTPYMYFGDYPILMLIFTFIFIHFRQQKKYG
jgi:apolipoprotein N-acyltransferase